MRKIATLRTLRFLSLLAALIPFSSRAGYVNVPVTGFTQDIVANGVGPASGSTTAAVDAVTDAFLSSDFNGAGIVSVTALPASRLIYSLQTSGLTYQLAPYGGNNSLRLTNTTPGTLSFVTPIAASEVFVLATSGSAPSPVTYTITFTDASTQVIASTTANTVPDWFGGAGFAVRGISRVNIVTSDIEMNVENPRLYEVRLTINPANYGKQIASVTFTKTGTNGVLNVMGIGANTIAACAAPASQPTALLITPSAVSATLSFIAPTPAPDKYLIVRTPLGAALTATPSNTTVYAVNATLGNGTVVSAGTATTFTESGLTPSTLYRYTVFAYNDQCTGGPFYNTTSPLTTTVLTTYFVNVPATGYNEDVVADTTGPARNSVTSDIDGGGYAFMAPNYNPSGTIFPTSSLPRGGVVNSISTGGLTFNLQPYTASNSLRISGTNSGTLSLVTPVQASDIYLLATSGAANSPVTVTLTFTDASTQTVTGLTVPDWYNPGTIALQGIGRVEIMPDAITNSALTAAPRLFEIRVPVNPANYAKLVASVQVTKTGATGFVNVMGVAAAPIAPCVTPASQPTGLTLAAGAGSVNVAFTAAAPNTDRYLIVRNAGTAALSAAPVDGIVYTPSTAIGNGTVIGVQAGNTITDAGLAASSAYRYTVFAFSDICGGGPKYNTTAALSDTISTVSGRTYTWNGSQNFLYTNPLNWTPARMNPDASDVLLFNNGIVNPVYGVISQTVRQLALSGNTTVHMQTSASTTLTLASDNNAATNELDIPAGSSLVFNGAVSTSSSLTLAFSGTGGTANIAGNLETYSLSSASSGSLNSINFTNATATIAAGGMLTIGGTHTTSPVTGTTAANLIVNGTLNYRFFNTAAPVIPVGNYGPGSLVTITGFSTVLPGNMISTVAPGNIGQQYANLSYDCKSQKALHGWAGNGPLNVTGTFTIASTGNGSLGLSTTQGYNHQVNNFVQTGGTLNLNTGVASATPTFNVSGSFTQSAGTLTSTGNSTGANAPVIHFNGAAAQTASFFNAAPVGPITYRISNPAGLTLVGTGTLTGPFNLNSNGGFRVSTTTVNPLTTALTLNYNATNTNLTYDAPGNHAATANVFPATNGPANLTINTGSSANVLSLPFSRTVSGTLNMTSGDIDVAGNVLSLGTSATALGTLNYTSGFIRTGTGGAFRRWFGTTASPTALPSGTTPNYAGFFPIGFNGQNRSVALFFSGATAFSTGGTVAVSHTNVAGFTNGLTVADGAYTIDTRTNSSWSFATAGTVLSGTIGMQLTGAGLFVSSNPANLRVMKANAVAGTHVAGAGQSAQRTGLVLSDLTSPHHIGAAAPDITGVYTAINTGNWSTGSTWDVGTAPGAANEAFINPGVTVTANAATNTARSLAILPGGILSIPTGNTVTLDSALFNSGTLNAGGGTMTISGRQAQSGIQNNTGGVINLSAGTINLGPANGGGMPFLQNGTLNVSGGTLNLNGNFRTVGTSVNSQTGGSINVDGNAGGVLASSVPCGTTLVDLQNSGNTFSGGTFTIVDPHACNTATVANGLAFGYTNGTSIAASGTHTFRMGDGVSSDAGGNAAVNFNVNTSTANAGKFGFWDLVINAGTGTNRFVQQGQTTLGVVHDLIINNGGEYRQTAATHNVYIANNLTVNTGGTFTPVGITNFSNYATGTVAASSNVQTVSGGGTFRNGISATPTARFNSIVVNNNAGGVSFNIGNTAYSGNITFTLGRIFMGSDILIQITGAGVTGAGQNTGWIVGKFQKAATGGLNHVFAIGDAQYYTPVTVTGTASTAGDLIASTTTGDHPSLSTSLINPARSVNRFWTISQVNGLTMSAAGGNVIPTWNPADLDAGATPSAFAGARYNATAFLPTTVSGAGATSITANVAATNIDGDYVFGETCAPLAITTPPAAQTVCSGSPVTFSVVVGGTAGVLYQWQKNGNPITGATASTYSIPSTAVGDAGNYTVVLSSQCGGVTPVTSAVAALAVNAAPAIATPPASQTVCENSPVTFGVAATGTGISYQWNFNGTPISGATGSSFSIPAVTAADAGSYTVVVTGTAICGSATSTAAVLTVNALPLNITAASTTTFCPGGSVVLNAAPGYTYQWRQNALPITGATSDAYTATVSGSYSVVVSSTATGCTGTSNAITVVANSAPPSAITPAGTAAYCTGGTVTLSGPTVAGITYQWLLNGTPIAGATNPTYAANAVGSYTLTVSAGTGCSTTSSATVVSMNALPLATATAAAGTTICAGNAVTLNANAGAGLTYVWNLAGVPVTPAATAASYSATTAGSYSVTVTNTATGCQNTSAPVSISVSALPAASIFVTRPTTFCTGDSAILTANSGTGLSYSWNLNATPLSPAVTNQGYAAKASGSYTVTVTDAATGCSNTSAASVITANPLPNVTVTAGGSLSICAGSSVTLSVPSATGQTYQWNLGGAAITGATTNTYSANAAGNYTVQATITGTGCVATSAIAAVTVNPLPTATITAVGSTTACAGDTVWLNANTGSGLSYQWDRNGTPISGATSSSYPATISGSYTVIVTNGTNCATTSAQTNVTVNPRPLSSISYTTPVTFCEGGAVVLTAISGTGVSYQWYDNAVQMPGSTGNFYLATTSGNYTVMVRNSFGCTETSPSILVVVNPMPQPVITRNETLLSTGSYDSYQWYLNSLPITGSTGQSHLVTANGGYTVRVTDMNGCTNYAPVFFFNSVGVPQMLTPDMIRVFPNPAQDRVYINAPVKVNIMLRDVAGRVVRQQNNASQIDMAELPDAVYQLVITDAQGRYLKTEKLVHSAR